MTEDEHFTLTVEMGEDDVKTILYALKFAYDKWPGNSLDHGQGERLDTMRKFYQKMAFEFQFHKS